LGPAEAARTLAQSLERARLRAETAINSHLVGVPAALRKRAQSELVDLQRVVEGLKPKSGSERRASAYKRRLDAGLRDGKKGYTMLCTAREALPFDTARLQRWDRALATVRADLNALKRVKEQLAQVPKKERGLARFHTFGWIAVEELTNLGLKPEIAVANAVAACLAPLVPPRRRERYSFTGDSLLQWIRARRRAGQTTAYSEPDWDGPYDFAAIRDSMFSDGILTASRCRAALEKIELDAALPNPKARRKSTK
jgi:hypothetical protein